MSGSFESRLIENSMTVGSTPRASIVRTLGAVCAKASDVWKPIARVKRVISPILMAEIGSKENLFLGDSVFKYQLLPESRGTNELTE